MTADEFRAMALSFPEAGEGSHFDTADFRVGKKIFATLRESDGRAVLKLSPDERLRRFEGLYDFARRFGGVALRADGS